MKHVKMIAALDAKGGIATKRGIPWDLPIDRKYFRDKTVNHTVVMGFNTYQQLVQPLSNRQNFVVCRPGSELREGFLPVYNLQSFLEQTEDVVWIIGGGKLYKQALPFADALYLTKIGRDFRCSVKFPDFHLEFKRASQSPDYHQNTLTFRFEIWERVNFNLSIKP